jgi:hypothetical protein
MQATPIYNDGVVLLTWGPPEDGRNKFAVWRSKATTLAQDLQCYPPQHDGDDKLSDEV